MQVATGPARYFFLRRLRGAPEEVSHWPPEIKPLQLPDNKVCAGVLLYPEEDGWRAECAGDEAALKGDLGGAFVLTRETTIGVTPDGGRNVIADLGLLGVRVALAGEKGPEYATHLVVKVLGGGFGAPNRPIVVPIDTLEIGQYVERGKHQRASAQLDLRMTGEELLSAPEYLPDPVIERLGNRTLDQAILSQRARHEIKPEVHAGRVSLYGQTEMTAVGDLAKEALSHSPGVVEVSDHMLYNELLQQQVAQALADRGYTGAQVLFENGLIVLNGFVADNASRHKAKDTALRIPGVRGVVNDLVVEPPPAAQAEQSRPSEPQRAEARS